MGTFYKVRMQHIGNYQFQLIDAQEILKTEK
ncbi:MAG: hypothetical protein RI993_283 [Pseudomonadota bacterium]|jgi:hypothetical protein